jgi:polyphosphate kinase
MDETARSELQAMFDQAMAPGVRCWELGPDAEWTRQGERDFQAVLMRRAGDRVE